MNGHWHYKGERLSVFAAIDFAFSTTQKSDYTALVVIGMDSNGFIYVLDMDRFKGATLSGDTVSYEQKLLRAKRRLLKNLKTITSATRGYLSQ